MFLQKRSDGNYERLKADMERDLIIPFIGAGLSVLSGKIYPTWKVFLIKNASDCIEPENILGEIDYGNYEKAADMIAKDNASFGLNIKTVFGELPQEYDKNSPVFLLPQIFGNSLVITTNFDYILEKLVYINNDAFDDTANFNSYSMLNDSMIEKRHYLLRLHGKANDLGEIIFTKSQYDMYYGENEEIDYSKALPKALKRIIETEPPPAGSRWVRTGG